MKREKEEKQSKSTSQKMQLLKEKEFDRASEASGRPATVDRCVKMGGVDHGHRKFAD